MKIEYRQEGDYLIPSMEIPNQPEREAGAWGKLRQDFLKKHKYNDFTLMLVSGTLKPHLMEVDEAASQKMDILTQRFLEAEQATEQMKAEEPLQWTRRAENAQARAREIVMAELIQA